STPSLLYLSMPSVFFFSSRRRHTRFSRDWSSDVCSSDLFVPLRPGEGAQASWNTVSAARAGRLAALGVVEAMRATRPGAYEYQLEAACRFAYLDHGAMDVSYRAVAAGGANA